MVSVSEHGMFCTFTALESVDTIIMETWRNERVSDELETPEKRKGKLTPSIAPHQSLSNRQ